MTAFNKEFSKKKKRDEDKHTFMHRAGEQIQYLSIQIR